MESERITIELGDIIQINAPENTSINNNIYLVDYIDSQEIKLIDTDNFNEKIEILNNNTEEKKSIKKEKRVIRKKSTRIKSKTDEKHSKKTNNEIIEAEIIGIIKAPPCCMIVQVEFIG